MENVPQKRSIDINYSIKKLSVKRFSYNETVISSRLLSDSNSTEDCQVQGNIRHTFTSATSLSIFLEFLISEKTSADMPIVEMALEAVYNVEQFTQNPEGERILLTGEEALIFPKEFIAMLVGASYSAARGILWTKLAATPLHSYLLPMVDSSALVNDSITATNKQEKVRKPAPRKKTQAKTSP